MMKKEMTVSVHDHKHLLVPQNTEEDVEVIEPSYHETKMSLMMGMMAYVLVMKHHQNDGNLMTNDQNDQVLHKKEPY